MKFVKRHLNALIAAGLALATFCVLFVNSTGLGLTRDEGYYIDAAEHYADWFRELAKNPGRALNDAVISRHYQVNREHPVLVKNMMALSYLAFAPPRGYGSSWPPRTRGGLVRAMRLPADLMSALCVALVFLFGAAVASRRVGLFAALAFILAPRHFFHARLACFDMPITLMWLATVMAYRKAKGSLKWSIMCGLLWGLALAVKLNAFFLPLVLGLHWLIVDGRKLSMSRVGLSLPRIPLAFFSMLLLGPVVFLLHWPFLWHATLERLGWYLSFHLNHVNYYWEYLGKLLTDPPFPWAYPFVVTALTLPLPTLLLAAIGFVGLLGRRLGRPVLTGMRVFLRLGGMQPAALAKPRELADVDRSDAWLLLLNAFIPLLIIAVPTVPIFGGMKHWLNAMPFACVLAGLALERLIGALPVRKLGRLHLTTRRVFAGLGGLVLLPSLLGLLHVGNYGTTYYNELAGGVDGGADLGMQRQYWSNDVSGVLPWINQNLPRGARLYLHEVNGECYRFFKRDGYLRNDLRMAWTPETSDYTSYLYHREFVDSEYRVWNLIGNETIAHGLYLDQVPLALVYDLERYRPGPSAIKTPKLMLRK